jgi:hypothetical protein
MSVKRNLSTSWKCTVAALTMGIFPSLGLCQSAVDQKAAETPAEPIEEIVVYGEKSLTNLRHEVYRTEENFFAAFNSLNEEEEYDIHCFYEVPSFTHIRRHVCRANFVKDATANEYAGWRRGQPALSARTVIMQKKRRLGEKMELLTAEHPELLEALSKYSDAKHVLKSEKDKCGGKFLVCGR